MEDRRAHDRIDSLEATMKTHFAEHRELSRSLTENTALTKSIEANTAELVALVRGAKGLRALVVWATPIVAAAVGLWAWLRAH